MKDLKVSAEDRGVLAEHFAGNAASLEPAIKRRAQGEPLAYILGYFDFMGARFSSDPRAYVTDPETEFLVRCVVREIDAIRERTAAWPIVAEIGFGGGALGITVKKMRPGIRLIGVDVDPDALALGTQNIATAGVDVELVRSDWFSDWPLADQPALIFGDPPWGGEQDLYSEDRDARHYLAMPSVSVFPKEGIIGAHLELLSDVKSKNWSSHMILNIGVLPDDLVKKVSALAAESKIERHLEKVGLLHARMCLD